MDQFMSRFRNFVADNKIIILLLSILALTYAFGMSYDMNSSLMIQILELIYRTFKLALMLSIIIVLVKVILKRME